MVLFVGNVNYGKCFSIHLRCDIVHIRYDFIVLFLLLLYCIDQNLNYLFTKKTHDKNARFPIETMFFLLEIFQKKSEPTLPYLRAYITKYMDFL